MREGASLLLSNKYIQRAARAVEWISDFASERERAQYCNNMLFSPDCWDWEAFVCPHSRACALVAACIVQINFVCRLLNSPVRPTNRQRSESLCTCSCAINLCTDFSTAPYVIRAPKDLFAKRTNCSQVICFWWPNDARVSKCWYESLGGRCCCFFVPGICIDGCLQKSRKTQKVAHLYSSLLWNDWVVTILST